MEYLSQYPGMSLRDAADQRLDALRRYADAGRLSDSDLELVIDQIEAEYAALAHLIRASAR